MNNTWVVVANAANCRVYDYHLKQHDLSCIKDFYHEESQMKRADLNSDRNGHYRNPVSTSKINAEPNDPKTIEKQRFAKEIINFLESKRVSNQFEQLMIFAPPEFQGLLTEYCPKTLDEQITKKLLKNYVDFTDQQLETYLHQNWFELTH